MNVASSGGIRGTKWTNNSINHHPNNTQSVRSFREDYMIDAFPLSFIPSKAAKLLQEKKIKLKKGITAKSTKSS